MDERANHLLSPLCPCLSESVRRQLIEIERMDEAKRFAQDRIQWILENQCRVPIRANTPISFYYKTSANLLDEADFFYKTNQDEESFILYSRYITYELLFAFRVASTRSFLFSLFVEELKRSHPNYSNASIGDRERVKEVGRKISPSEIVDDSIRSFARKFSLGPKN